MTRALAYMKMRPAHLTTAAVICAAITLGNVGAGRLHRVEARGQRLDVARVREDLLGVDGEPAVVLLLRAVGQLPLGLTNRVHDRPGDDVRGYPLNPLA